MTSKERAYVYIQLPGTLEVWTAGYYELGKLCIRSSKSDVMR